MYMRGHVTRLIIIIHCAATVQCLQHVLYLNFKVYIDAAKKHDVPVVHVAHKLHGVHIYCSGVNILTLCV